MALPMCYGAGRMNSTKLQPDWWARVPEGERRFLRVLMGKIEDVAEAGPPEVAGFAQVWGRSLACFIKTRLKYRRRRTPKIHLALPSGFPSPPQDGCPKSLDRFAERGPHRGEGEKEAA